jgi:hypothetical protein
MGKKKGKKSNLKKERYAKFHREKNSSLDLTMPDLTDEQIRERREDDTRFSKFMRFNKNKPPHEVVARREKDKR